MKPIFIPQTNQKILNLEDDEFSLPCTFCDEFQSKPVVVAYKLTKEEIERISQTGIVYVVQETNGYPVRVVEPFVFLEETPTNPVGEDYYNQLNQSQKILFLRMSGYKSEQEKEILLKAMYSSFEHFIKLCDAGIDAECRENLLKLTIKA